MTFPTSWSSPVSALSINFPTPDHDSEDTAISSRFVAVGTVSLDAYRSRYGADPKIKTVTAKLILRDGTNRQIAEGKTLSIRFVPNEKDPTPPGYFKWAISFKTNVAAPTPVQLLVIAGTEDNAELLRGHVNLWIEQYIDHHAVPSFDVPGDNPHQLTTGEQSYFFVCGPSDHPLTELKFNGNPSDHAEWTVGDEYFWGEFYNLGATAGAVLAANADGPTSITITT